MNVRRVLAEKRRILFPLLLFAIANVVLYALVVFPLGHQVSNAEQEAKTQREVLRRAVLDYQSAKAMVTGKQQADTALQTFYKSVLPASYGAARTLTYTRLSQLAKQANVRLEHGANTVAPEKGTHLKKLTTSYTLTGDYRDVRRFIYSLETTPEFIVLENVALTYAGDQAQMGRSLAINLEIATYFRSDDAGA